MAEQAMSTPSSQSRTKMLSGTRAPRHEVLEPLAHRHDLPTGVEVTDAVGGVDDLTEGGELGSGRVGEPTGQTVERPGLAREQELVVFAAPGRPGQRIAPEGPRDVADRTVDGDTTELHAGACSALLADMAEVGGETVREVQHRGDASGLREPLSLTRPGSGPEVCACHVDDGVGRDTSRGLWRFQ